MTRVVSAALTLDLEDRFYEFRAHSRILVVDSYTEQSGSHLLLTDLL